MSRSSRSGAGATVVGARAPVGGVTNLDDVVAPLFVIHGANDPRVPLSEAEQIRDALAGTWRAERAGQARPARPGPPAGLGVE